MKLFDYKDCIIYAQVIDIGSPHGGIKAERIDHQSEVRPAVQAIINVYSSGQADWKGCSGFFPFYISEAMDEKKAKEKGRSKEKLEEILEIAKSRGYEIPEQFDAVVVGVHFTKEDHGTPPFDLDKVLSDFFMKKYNP